MDAIHNVYCMEVSTKVDGKSNDVASVCPVCEAEKVEKDKAYWAEVYGSWADWHARNDPPKKSKSGKSEGLP